MKHLNFLSNLLSLSLGSPCTDVSLDRRFTVGSPSRRYSSTMLKLVTVLAILMTVGVGNVWGAVNNGDLFERISSAPSANDEVIIVNSGGTVVLGGQNGNFRDDEAITTSSNQYIYINQQIKRKS